MSGEMDKNGIGELIRTVKGAIPEGMKLTPTGWTAEGDRVAPEMESYGELANGKVYNNHYHFLVTVADGKITTLRECHRTEVKMLKDVDDPEFQTINRGYNSVFRPNRLSLGVVMPLETYSAGPVPSMTRHMERVQLAEELGFSAIWLRDVPFNVPSFGDAGQIYDPFVYLGLLAGQTERIALGVASIVLPLRHPAHVAKAAADVDVLSGGRLILGVASGDPPEEYPALNLPFAERGARFRASFDYIKRMWEDSPAFENTYGSLYGGMDMLPKPAPGKLPLLITEGSQQDPDWIARSA